ncbi:MAG: hypothetical protein AB7F43_10760 [Bacteriovoracia bacterium]
MARLDNLRQKLDLLLDKIRDSESYQQIKSKYDELDAEQKLYANLVGIAAVLGLIVISVFYGMVKVSSLKAQINEREELIGYLQNAADNIKQMKAQSAGKKSAGVDPGASLENAIETIATNAGINPEKLEIGKESTGDEDKTSKELLVDVKMAQTNLRQVTRFLFALTDQGKQKGIVIKNLGIDTKNDPSGYLDASFTVASYVSK